MQAQRERQNQSRDHSTDQDRSDDNSTPLYQYIIDAAEGKKAYRPDRSCCDDLKKTKQKCNLSQEAQIMQGLWEYLEQEKQEKKMK